MKENVEVINHNIYGYFMHGNVKWLLIEIDGDTLKGIDITPKGFIHTLVINESEVYGLTLLNKGQKI